MQTSTASAVAHAGHNSVVPVRHTTFENGDTLSIPPLDMRPVGFRDGRNRPRKRTPEEIAEQKQAAREERERKLQLADEFHGQTNKGPAIRHHHRWARQEAAERFGLKYHRVWAPRDSNQVRNLVKHTKRETAETRSATMYIPQSVELMERSAA